MASKMYWSFSCLVICDIVWLVLSIAYTSSMHHELKQKAIELRMSRHLSYSAILAQIPVAKSTLSEWLKNYPLRKDRILELKRLAWKKNEIKIELFRETMRAKREEKDKKILQYSKRENTSPTSVISNHGR